MEIEDIPFEIVPPLVAKKIDGIIWVVNETTHYRFCKIWEDKVDMVSESNIVIHKDGEYTHPLVYKPTESIKEMRADPTDESLVEVTAVDDSYPDGWVYSHKGHRVVPIDPATQHALDLGIKDYLGRKDKDAIMSVFKKLYPDWRDYLIEDTSKDVIFFNPAMLNRHRRDDEVPFEDKFEWFEGNGGVGVTNVLTQINQRTFQKTDKGKWIGIDCSDKILGDVMESLAHQNRRDMFKELIEGTKWDGVPRIRSFLQDIGFTMGHLNDEDDPRESLEEEVYLAEEGISLITGIIEKMYHPYQEDDSSSRKPKFAFVLIGYTNQGKSLLSETLSFARYKMGLDHLGWLSHTTKAMNKKEFREELGGIVAELPEGESLKGVSNELVKGEIEQWGGVWRTPYSRHPTYHHIRYSYIITTNNYDVLTDLTGNSRYHILYMDNDKAADYFRNSEEWATPDTMLQIYAEGLELYREGIRWDTRMNSDSNYKRILEMVQRGATTVLPGMVDIGEWLDSTRPNLDDKVSIDAVNSYIRDELKYSGKEADELLSNFKSGCENLFGFRYKKQLWVEKNEGAAKTKRRGFYRIREIEIRN